MTVTDDARPSTPSVKLTLFVQPIKTKSASGIYKIPKFIYLFNTGIVIDVTISFKP